MQLIKTFPTLMLCNVTMLGFFLKSELNKQG